MFFYCSFYIFFFLVYSNFMSLSSSSLGFFDILGSLVCLTCFLGVNFSHTFISCLNDTLFLSFDTFVNLFIDFSILFDSLHFVSYISLLFYFGSCWSFICVCDGSHYCCIWGSSWGWSWWKYIEWSLYWVLNWLFNIVFNCFVIFFCGDWVCFLNLFNLLFNLFSLFSLLILFDLLNLFGVMMMDLFSVMVMNILNMMMMNIFDVVMMNRIIPWAWCCCIFHNTIYSFINNFLRIWINAIPISIAVSLDS